MIGLPIIWWLRTLAFAEFTLAVFGAIEMHPKKVASAICILFSGDEFRHTRNEDPDHTNRPTFPTLNALRNTLFERSRQRDTR